MICNLVCAFQCVACLHEDTYFKKDARRLCGAQLHHRTYTLCTIPYPGAGGLHIAHSPLYSWFVFKCTSKFSLSIVYEMSQDLSIVLLEKFSKFNTAKKSQVSKLCYVGIGTCTRDLRIAI